MKQKITFFKVLLTLVLLCGVGNAWAKDITYTFNSKSWTCTVEDDSWTSKKPGDQLTTGQGVQVTSSATGAGAASPISFSNISKIVVKYCTNASKGAGAIKIQVGSGAEKSFTVTKPSSGGTTLKNATFDYNTPESGFVTLTVNCTTNSIYINSVTITYSENPFKVTFAPGTNGTCSTSSLTETSAGAGITLPSCTAKDGYVFKGWSTTENGTTADAGMAGETYKPSSNCTLYAVYNKTYVLTITQPTDGGTLTVSDGTKALSTGDNVEVGANLNCEVTNIPEGQRFSRFYAKWSDDENDKKYKATNPATFDEIPTDISTLEVYVTYMSLEKYTINYMVNGVNTNAQENIYEDTALEFPTVYDFGGKVFVGWSETEISDPTDDKPTLVETTGLKASKNVTYYAVFATATEGSQKNEELTNDNIKSLSSSKALAYTTKTTFAGTDLNYTIYAYTDGARPWLQLKKDEKVYVKITAPQNILKVDVTITSATNSSGGVADISKHTAFSGTVGLVTTDCSFSETSEYVGKTSTITDNVATINVTGDSNELYLKVSTGARIWGITTYYGTPTTYNGYCTTVAPQTQNVNITLAGYATAYIPFNSTVEGATAYYVTIDGNKAQLNEIEGTIPANKGVVLKGSAGTVTFTESAVTPTTDVSENKMVGSLAGETFKQDGFVYYRLANNNGNVGFYKQHENGSAYCDAGKAVLEVPVTAAPSFFTFDDATAINAISNVKTSSVRYNLNGQAVGEDYKGIVIVNGKKMFNK